MGLGRLTSNSITHINLHKPNNKLVSVFGALWCMDEPWVNTDSQDSPWPGLGGSHHLPLIVYSVHGHGTNIQMSFCPRSLEIPKVRTLTTLGGYNFVCRPSIKMGSKAKL
jgi:hypothetical protein